MKNKDKGGEAFEEKMINDEFSFGRTASVPSVTQLLKQFPTLPANALLALAVWTLLARTVTPWRVCGCGCGEAVTGKAKFASPAFRKRLERERNALRAGAKNLNLILQYEIPATIATMPVVTVPAEIKLEIVGNNFPFRHFVDAKSRQNFRFSHPKFSGCFRLFRLPAKNGWLIVWSLTQRKTAMKKTWKSKRTVCRGSKSGRFASKGKCRAYRRTKVKRHFMGFLFK